MRGGSGLSDEKTCVMCISQCLCPRTGSLPQIWYKSSCSCLNNAENQLVKHSNEKSSKRRADLTPERLATAFGAPLNEFGDGGGHLGSAAARVVARRRIRVEKTAVDRMLYGNRQSDTRVLRT